MNEQKQAAPKVTIDQIEGKIRKQYFMNAKAAFNGVPNVCEELNNVTVCFLVLNNGFVVVGKSACASAENFEQEVGMKIARENAIEQVWALEGYVLRNHLSAAKQH